MSRAIVTSVKPPTPKASAKPVAAAAAAAAATSTPAITDHKSAPAAKAVTAAVAPSNGKASSGARRFIIAGPPAAGKGTQCDLLVAKYGCVHVSTGDLLRAEVSKNSAVGIEAKSYMTRGALVPDEIVFSLLKARLAEGDCVSRGWLLDGFPRTEEEVHLLNAASIVPERFLLLDVPDSVLLDRVTGRRIDPQTGKSYHIRSLPADEAIVKRLITRKDDTADALTNRLSDYHKHINAVRGSYADKLLTVNGDQTADKIFALLSAQIDTAAAAAPAASGRRFIIAGPPAAGKGTQCDLITAKYNCVHVSTGDLLRAEVKKNSAVGIEAKSYMTRGALVPDEIVFSLLKARLAEADCVSRGWLLDGFPRTEEEVHLLNAASIVPERFILLDVPDGVLLDRCTGRRVDPETGKSYHIRSLPADEAIVKRLITRKDDTAEALTNRLTDYHKHIDAVRGAYSNKMLVVNGDQSADKIFSFISSSL